MKQKRRSFISILLSMCMAVTACGFTAFAAEPQQVNYYVNSSEGWAGSGYEMTEPIWGKIEFSNYGDVYGEYIFNKYDFQDDFSLVSRQTNVYENKENPNPVHNILFCYQDSNNYYKFTYGGAPSTLSKVIDGEETQLGSAEATGAQTEISIKVSHSADGTITASYGPKDGDGTGTDLFTVQDTSLTSGKFGFSSKGAGGYIANVTLSGTAVENASATEPSPTASTAPSPSSNPDNDEINLTVSSLDDWTVTGNYTMGTWKNIGFSHEGDTSGSAIYNKYYFSDKFSITTNQTNVYYGVHNILFGYQDEDNYYKLTYGTGDTTLSKVVNGTETVITTGESTGVGVELSLRVAHTEDGTITVSTDAAGTFEPKNEILTANDTTFNSGKIGFSSHSAGGYIANVLLIGTASEGSSPVTPPPTPSTSSEPDDGTISYKVTSLDDWTVTGSYAIAESKPGSNWWQVNFSNYGENSGSAIFNKYDFSEDFSILTTNTSVYSNTDSKYPNPVHNILFCYQNENNYYKLTYGATATTLSKVINGVETILDEGDAIGNNNQVALKITYTNGNISASFGASGSAGTDTELVLASDTSLTHGKIGFSSASAGGHISDITLSGKASENSSDVTPPPTESTEPDDGTISYKVNSLDDWTCSGYTISEISPDWWRVDFSNYGENSGSAIFDKYDFSENFSIITTMTNVYSGSHNILFFYQDSNNYYKLTYGAGATTLSKVIDGAESEIASGESIGTSTEISLKISYNNGNITVLKDAKAVADPKEEILSATDMSLTHGKIGFSSKGAGGCIADITLSGKATENSSDVTPPPTESTEPDDGTINYDVTSLDDWSGSGYTMGTWNNIEFLNYGENSGMIIFDKYSFVDSFSIFTPQTNVYSGSHDILFCYQDGNNYYKLTYGAGATTLSKVVGGTESEIASGASIGSGTEVSLIISRAADGTITVNKGAKGSYNPDINLITTKDTSLSGGKIGLYSRGAGGYIANLRLSGNISENPVTPPPTEPDEPTDDNVTYIVRSDEGWVGSGYEMAAASWGQITFDSLGTVGSYVLETYDFADNMSFMTAQTNIYSGSNTILFCYQDNNNYYKLSYNKDTAVLSKLVNGFESIIAESSSAVSADKEFSLKVSRNVNGTITVTSGKKAGDGTGNFILSARDSSLTHGMMGMTSTNSQGYAALITVSGSTAEPSEALTISNIDNGTDSITVDYTAADIDSSSIIAAVLYDASGRMAAMTSAEASADGSISIPVSGLDGTYTVVLFNWDSISGLKPMSECSAVAGVEI
jgi:hypothetical protein